MEDSPTIQLLPENIANQIAAGEVVIRPANIVKELLENAIDSKAKKIDLTIKESGKTLIQVTDNGTGMSHQDIRMAFERHATSKIKSLSDLYSIKTKGFRGEALAAISSISEVEAVSKKNEHQLGSCLEIDNGTIIKHDFKSTPDGTTITVKNIFFKTPARKKFLKNNAVELKHIIDEFLRVAIIHPEIQFTFKHSESILYQLPSSNFKMRICQIFGNTIEKKLIDVKEKNEIFSLEGFVSKSEYSKKQRGEQFLFINNRFFRSNYFHHAIMSSYGNLLAEKSYPSYFLHFTVDFSKIDVNVHPSKTEILFEDEKVMYQLLLNCIRNSLGFLNFNTELHFERNNPFNKVSQQSSLDSNTAPKTTTNPDFNPFDTPQIQSSKIFSQEENDLSLEIYNDGKSVFADEMEMAFDYFVFQNKYFILHYEESIWAIHVSRAHYTQIFKKIYQPNYVHSSQKCLFNINIPCSKTIWLILENYSSLLDSLGFSLKYDTKKQEIEISQIPVGMQNSRIKELFELFFSQISQNNSPDIDISKLIFNNLAKKMAVDSPNSLNIMEQNYLIKEMLKWEENWSPDNKKIWVSLKSFAEIENLF